MARFGSVCVIGENVNNHLRIHSTPVQHSASGVSTQSSRHSAVRCRRRKPSSDSETSRGIVSSRSTSRSVGDLSAGFTDYVDLIASSNGTVPSGVDTADVPNQMTHLDSCLSPECCQDLVTGVQNAAGNGVLAETTDIVDQVLSENDENKRLSDAWIHKTLNSGSRNGTACISNIGDGESSLLTAARGVPIFKYSISDGKASGCNARIKRTLRSRSAIDYHVPNISVNGFPPIEYLNEDDTSTISDARNKNRVVARSEADGALAKVGDFDREQEIERRMRELGLWEFKREQERHLAELIDSQISRRDGLTAALGRCRRRQRGQLAVSASDDIRSHVNHQFIRYDRFALPVDGAAIFDDRLFASPSTDR